jgi:hypothetical protein
MYSAHIHMTYSIHVNDVLWLGIIAVISDGMMTYISLFIYNIYIYIYVATYILFTI